mgnify:CR=1 FL=1
MKKSSKRRRKSSPSLASTADRHRLYELSVQCAEAEIDFVEETWRALRDRPAELLREDFCGTAATACEWVRRDPLHVAIGVDLDGSVLDWGEANNVAALSEEQAGRIELRQQDVLEPADELADIALAMNFSYYLFLQRHELLAYFRNVLDGLMDDGLFLLDAYGGYDAPRNIVEERECEGFTYIWEQSAFDPITHRMHCHIHFAFPDGSELPNAFNYEWRLWSVPEVRDLLLECGFKRVTVYWQGWDKHGEPDGDYKPATRADADAGWICYLSAER